MKCIMQTELAHASSRWLNYCVARAACNGGGGYGARDMGRGHRAGDMGMGTCGRGNVTRDIGQRT